MGTRRHRGVRAPRAGRAVPRPSATARASRSGMADDRRWIEAVVEGGRRPLRFWHPAGDAPPDRGRRRHDVSGDGGLRGRDHRRVGVVDPKQADTSPARSPAAGVVRPQSRARTELHAPHDGRVRLLAASVQLRRHAGGPDGFDVGALFDRFQSRLCSARRAARPRDQPAAQDHGVALEPPGLDEDHRQPDPGNPPPRGVRAPRRLLPALHRGVPRRRGAHLRHHGAERAPLRAADLSGHAARASRARHLCRSVSRAALRA